MILVIGIIIIFALIGVFALKGKQTNPLTPFGESIISAKSVYPIVVSEAKKFSGDSFLVDLNTTGVQKDGKSKTWYALFYSPSKKTNFKINLVEGKVDKTEEGDKKKTEPISEGWIDSINVAKIAIPKCEETGMVAEPDYFISLDPGKNGKNATWRMNCLVGENKTLTVDVDAVTGEFIKTGKAGIGW